MSKKIIALDLDGTLLNSEGKVSTTSKNVLKQVEKQGHLIVITTGRPYRMAEPIYRDLELSSPMINFNGSLTHIPYKKWDRELSMTLDKKYLLDMVNREEEIEADFIAGEYRNKFYITHTNHHKIDPNLFGVNEIASQTKFIAEKVTDNPNAILLQTRATDKYALAEEMTNYYKKELEINGWGGPLNILECAPKGVNKAFALNYLLEVTGLNSSDLLAFGDEQNDTEMLSFAGTSYAMKNANPILLPYADHQTDYTNDEDGVAKQLEKLFL
ncbi:Hydrolase (HAD superfamily) [Streptococcus sp. DD10]|uniref:Cof-type HAD-IIB family hydrolase n=1 Tax=Streptococcus sp. DD10 TaxID=1777878 RepID=UPI0007994AEA|nr:Cof-type HAD-IIB family hydrolase [Streptococcus sp. DD10]KXT73570.1 Hydrolase (HAD superfamily) [Streptococcus sp. DD10]